MTKNIVEIFERYDTDKGVKGHNYAPYYQKHLPDKVDSLLEIGVLKGESIKMWHEIYPEAHIYGLDLFQENPIPFEASWVSWFKGSQVDEALLEEVKRSGPFDIIIDDGSHVSEHQLATYYSLIGSCKLYIVEDLHCCRSEFWRQIKYDNTMLAMMKAKTFPLKNDLYLDKISFIYAD